MKFNRFKFITIKEVKATPSVTTRPLLKNLEPIRVKIIANMYDESNKTKMSCGVILLLYRGRAAVQIYRFVISILFVF